MTRLVLTQIRQQKTVLLYYLVSFLICLSHMTINSVILHLIAIKFVLKAKPLDLCIRLLSIETAVVNSIFI